MASTFNGTLTLTITDAKDLSNKDYGRQDPYCKVTLGSKGIYKKLMEGESWGNEAFITKTHEQGGSNPVWNETHTLNITNMQLDSRLSISLYDRDKFKDDYIGITKITLEELLRNQGQKYYYDLAEKPYKPTVAGRVGIIAKFNCSEIPRVTGGLAATIMGAVRPREKKAVLPPGQSTQSSVPQSSVQSSVPQSSVQSSAPLSSVQSSAPLSTVQSSAPLSTVQSSVPQSSQTTGYSSVPQSSQTSYQGQPSTGYQSSVPQSSQTSYQPTSDYQSGISQPTTGYQSSVPGSSQTSYQGQPTTGYQSGVSQPTTGYQSQPTTGDLSSLSSTHSNIAHPAHSTSVPQTTGYSSVPDTHSSIQSTQSSVPDYQTQSTTGNQDYLSQQGGYLSKQGGYQGQQIGSQDQTYQQDPSISSQGTGKYGTFGSDNQGYQGIGGPVNQGQYGTTVKDQIIGQGTQGSSYQGQSQLGNPRV